MPKIFISYRREDSAYAAGTIRDQLAAPFGPGDIFFDVESIPYGHDFRTHLDRSVGACDYLIAVIGKSWLTACDDSGQRRLDNPVDYVRLEIEAALRRNIPVIPVLLDNAPMPKADQLPGDLRLLAYRNAIAVRPPPDFKKDVEKLARTIQEQDRERLKPEAPQQPPATEENQPAPQRPVRAPASPKTEGPEPVPKPTNGLEKGQAGALRLALLYRRNVQPDEQLLKWLEKTFAAHGHQVFVDRHMAIGVEWAAELERQVRGADAVILLLSAASVQSEMMAYEIQIAHDEAQKRNGRPLLLPVRINHEGPLPAELAGILDRLQYFLWQGPQDNQRLINGLLGAIQNPPPIKAIPPPAGVIPLDSAFYVVRPTDQEFQAALARRDSVVLIRGARQMGKTSLLARGLQQTRLAETRVVLTDFQKLNAADLVSAETLFRTLAEWLADELDLQAAPGDVWSARRGPSVNFERYMRREVLDKVATPLVWAMDEVDRLFPCPYASEVFGLFRSWHNARGLDPSSPWEKLTLAIAYATEAHLFITDMNQSPFNVGTLLVLEDFTPDQVADLNQRYGKPLRDAAEVQRFVRLVGGHPYLVNRGLYELVHRKVDLAGFEALAGREEGIFGDHLRRILVLLAKNAELCEVVRGVLRGRPCPSTETFYHLRSAGVLAGDSARDARPRCQLYASYLERHLL
jgi:hypothetical protein